MSDKKLDLVTSSRNKNAMNREKDVEDKKQSKFDNCYCPVCGIPRQKGSHAKCSRITQLKGMKERGEI